MPRIILHTPEPASAAALYVRHLLLGLTSLGIRLNLVCPENFQFRTELERDPNVTICPAPTRSIDRENSVLTRISRNLSFLISSCTRLFRYAKPGDIVHFQFVLRFPFGALLFLAAKLRGCRIVFTVHDPLPHKWLLPAMYRRAEQWVIQWAYGVSDELIVHSEPGKRVLTEIFDQAASKIQIIAHGPYELSRCMPMRSSKHLEVLCFGSIRENKGVDLAIRAVQSLYQQGIPIRLTIAGTVLNIAEQPYWQSCLKTIARQPEPIHVMDKFVPDAELADLFAASHCVVLPYTRFFSDSGVAMMALSNERPIIATRSGGLGPLLDSANLGIAIQEPTDTGVAEALLLAAELGIEELAHRGRTGAQHIKSEFGWQKIAEKTWAVYKRHLSDASRLATGQRESDIQNKFRQPSLNDLRSPSER